MINQFVKKIVVFGGVFVILSITFLSVLSSIFSFYPKQQYYSSEFNMAFNDKNVELIALGNSKLLSSLNKNVLQKEMHLKCANLGYSSSNISISRLTLESYLNKCNVKPKVVLMEVSWFSFNDKRTTLHHFAADLLLNDIRLWKIAPRYFPKILNSIPGAIFRQISLCLGKHSSDSFQENNKLDVSTTKQYKFIENDFNKVFPTHVAGVNKLLLDDFYALVSMCKRNNILLILYTSPEDMEYSLLQRDRTIIKDIYRKIDQSDKNIYYLDYSPGGDLYKKQYEFWMKDSHHIFADKLFTQKLTYDIKNALNDKFVK